MTALRRSTTHPEPKQKSLTRAHTLHRELEQRQASSGGAATKKASSLASAEELRRRQVEAARLPDGGKQLGSAVAAQLAGRVRLTTVSPMQPLAGGSAMFAPHSALSAGQAQLAPGYTQASWSRRMLTDRWGSDCWCQRTCSAMQLQLVIDSARSRYPERYSQDLSHRHGGQLVGSGRQSGPWLYPGCEHGR